MAYVAAPFNVPLIVMRRRNLLVAALAPHGIAVEWPEITSGAKQVQAIAAGSVDVASVLGGASATRSGSTALALSDRDRTAAAGAARHSARAARRGISVRRRVSNPSPGR
jgi:ABC-type nitrate/sulfonate/bicarbonate transport system substrate-binding protein